MTSQTQIDRSALMKRFDGFNGRKALFIHAPAGFGKTTSASLWLKHREKIENTRYAWVTLDEHDNMMTNFCRRFVSALACLQPENDVLRELSGHPVISSAPMKFVQYAIEALPDTDEPRVLVFDDMHVIVDEEILAVWPRWLKKLPKSCSALLLSRTAPPDSFSDLVMKDALAIVDGESLRFTNEEIKTFFMKNGSVITSRKADEIHTVTGGWAIALRAMILAGQTAYNIDLTGQYLEHFIETHVWSRWNERTKRFLLLVAVVSELDPELCGHLVAGEALLRAEDCAEILIWLARENAFLRETGPSNYRFHGLFRDFLLHKLAELPDQPAAQYIRAGDYYFAKGDYFRAVEYFLAGENDDGVAKSIYYMYDYNSDAASIGDTLYIIQKSLSEPLVEKHPFLLEVQAWAAFVEGRCHDFENCMDKYYKLFPKLVLNNPRTAITGALLRCIDFRNDCVPLMKKLHRVPLKGIIDIRAFTPSITNNLPFFHRSVRDLSELAGDPEENIAWLEKGVGAIIGAEWVVLKECLYAGFYYEKGEATDACEMALAACGHVTDACAAEVKFCALMILAAAQRADGQEQDVRDALSDIKRMIERDKAFYLEANLKAFTCRDKLADGDVAAAREWLREHAKSFGDNLPIYKTYQFATTARAHIVVGEYTKAILLLKKLLILGECYRRPLDVIEYRILLAIVYWKKGRGGHQTAMEYIEEAARMAHKYGYKQLFANEGADLVSMLSRLHNRAVQNNQAGGPFATFARTLYMLAFAASKRSKGLAGGRAAKKISFTEKQKTVMRLMSEGYSRNAIAERMGLKPSGVKTHMELIYNKLGVSSSVEAILKIKGLRVLGEV